MNCASRGSRADGDVEEIDPFDRRHRAGDQLALDHLVPHVLQNLADWFDPGLQIGVIDRSDHHGQVRVVVRPPYICDDPELLLDFPGQQERCEVAFRARHRDEGDATVVEKSGLIGHEKPLLECALMHTW